MTMTAQEISVLQGLKHGVARGSWVIDGNTDVEYAQRVLDGYNDGDPEIMDMMPAPLSGQWADEQVKDLSDHYGINLEDEDVAGWFEEGFSIGYWHEIVKACEAIVPIKAGVMPASVWNDMWREVPDDNDVRDEASDVVISFLGEFGVQPNDESSDSDAVLAAQGAMEIGYLLHIKQQRVEADVLARREAEAALFSEICQKVAEYSVLVKDQPQLVCQSIAENFGDDWYTNYGLEHPDITEMFGA